MEILYLVLYNISFALIGYIIGSVSFAILLVKILKLQDIRKTGSGNAGATNMTRTHGKKFGAFVFLGDFLKLPLAITISWLLMKFVPEFKSEYIYIQFTGLFVIIGHIFPIFHKFKGGKGASSYAGYVSTFMWPLFPLGIVAWFSTFKKTKMVSVATIIGSFIITVIYGVVLFLIQHFRIENYTNWLFIFQTNYKWWISTIFIFVAWVILVIKHKSNIKRILNGTESKFINKKKMEEKTAIINLQTKEISYLDPTTEFNPKTTTIEITEVEVPSTNTINVIKKESEVAEKMEELKKLVDDKERMQQLKDENKNSNE